MKDKFLLDNLEKLFSGYTKPSIIYNLSPEEVVTNEYLAIQRDFGSLLKNEMSDEQCSMMICDSWLISDQALCYFLPRIAKMVLQNRGYEDLLYRRLESLNTTFLDQDQKAIVNHLITTLKKIEEEMEMEEKQELEQSWADWEEVRWQSDNINDKLLLAIARGSIDDIKTLINQGANVNERDNQGNSPLDIAKYKGHIEQHAN